MSPRIRVLHPITRLIIGGAQENTMLTAELLEPGEWEVEILSGPQTGSEGSLIGTVRDRSIQLTIEPSLVREINPVKDLLALTRLTRFMRHGRYTIVHTHSSKAGIIGRWAAKLAGVPVIVHTVHGWGHHEHQHPLVRAYYILMERLTLTVTDKLIVVSPVNIEKGVRDGIGKPENYAVIRSGIELDRFGQPQVPREQTRLEWGVPVDVPVVGTVTRLSPQKAPLDFVRAAGAIAAALPKTYFMMVGDGSLRGEVAALARSVGIADRFVMTGLRRDVAELLPAFDVFVLSSLWEGLPRVLPQAMATGLPVVATATDGSVEIIEHNVNGVLVPPGNPHAMADAAIRLLQDPELARRMGHAGRMRATEFDVRMMVAQIAGLYKELLRKKGISSIDRQRELS